MSMAKKLTQPKKGVFVKVTIKKENPVHKVLVKQNPPGKN
jgi:hypothetical protein